MQELKKRKNTIALIIASVIGALFLMWPAFYNGYPIINPDTGSFLSAFIPAIPADRPFTYSFVLRTLSFNGLSLWPVVFFQAYAVSWLLLRVIKYCINSPQYLLSGMLIIIFLAFDTSLSWTVSQLQLISARP